MESTRIEARDSALQLLNRLTFGIAAAALAAMGVFSGVSAATIPGTTTSASSASSPASASNADTSSSSSSSSTSSSDLQPSSGGVSSAPSGTGVVATGASH